MKFRLKFGSMPPTEKGVTENIGAGGLFIRTDTMFSKGTILRIAFILPKNIVVKVDGEVVWKREFSSKFIRMMLKNGLGIKFIRFYAGEQKYKELIRGLQEERR